VCVVLVWCVCGCVHVSPRFSPSLSFPLSHNTHFLWPCLSLTQHTTHTFSGPVSLTQHTLSLALSLSLTTHNTHNNTHTHTHTHTHTRQPARRGETALVCRVA